MIVIGITGGIGSGKSLACRYFRALNVEVLEADPLAKNLMQTNPALKKRLLEQFGSETFLPDSALNTAYLADKVFHDAAQLKLLDAIVHPIVKKELEEKISSYEQEGKQPFIIIEAALIFEAKMHEMMDYILVVDTEEETRIQRVMKRDGTTREAVLLRMSNQMPAAEKRSYADFVLESNGTKEEFEERIKFFYTLFLALSQTQPLPEGN